MYDISVFKEMDSLLLGSVSVTGDEVYYFYSEGRDLAFNVDDLIVQEAKLATDSLSKSLFAYIYQKELKLTKSPIMFFEEYKESNINIYPESTFFQFAKVVPISFIKDKVSAFKASVIG
jgi:hypothetical protein